MNKICFSFILIIGLLCPQTNLFAGVIRDGEPTDILITEGGHGSSPIIYAPALIPIQAAYSSSHSTIFVNFLYDLGYVSVEIENLTTGEYAEYSFDSSSTAYFPISGNTGSWRITLTLLDNEVYIGEFEL